MIRRGKWTMDTRSTALYALAWTLVIVLFAFLHRRRRDVKWPLVQGTIQDTRIVSDHALQTGWGGQVTWKAEYKVAYAVATRIFSMGRFWYPRCQRSRCSIGLAAIAPFVSGAVQSRNTRSIRRKLPMKN
jgi:hypothetical protein